jgi:hypothetical protein
VYIPASTSIYGLDEWRQLNGGFEHIECAVGNFTCTYHYDVYSITASNPLFGTVSHAAETLDAICWNKIFTLGFSPNIYGCTSIGVAYILIILYAILIFPTYYGVKYGFLYAKERFNF